MYFLVTIGSKETGKHNNDYLDLNLVINLKYFQNYYAF